MPGRTCCRPLTITRSPGFRPSVIARRPSCSNPEPNGAGDDLVLVVDDVQDLLALIVIDGTVGDQQGLMERADGHTDAGKESWR